METTITICGARPEDFTLETLVDDIMSELREAWRRKLSTTPDRAEAYADAVRPYVEQFTAGAVVNLVTALQENMDVCGRGEAEEFEIEGEDGYWDEEEQRGMWVYIKATVRCKELGTYKDVLESMSKGFVRAGTVFESYYCRLPPEKRAVIDPLRACPAPHEVVLGLLKKLKDARWWYTVYYTNNK